MLETSQIRVVSVGPVHAGPVQTGTNSGDHWRGDGRAFGGPSFGTVWSSKFHDTRGNGQVFQI